MDVLLEKVLKENLVMLKGIIDDIVAESQK
jgi:hypothetical protein